MKENIYIIGAGAVGKALAVFLKNAGRQVTLIRGRVDDGSTRFEKIRVHLSDATETAAEIEIGTLKSYTRFDGPVVLTSKSFANEHLAPALKDKIDGSPLVILQNGLGIEAPFIEQDFPGVYRSVLFATSQFASDGQIIFKPVADSVIGIVRGRRKELDRLVKCLDTRLFPFKAEAEIQTVIWKKTIINSVFNSICPLLEVDNGIFHRNAAALALAKRIVEECAVIAGESGIYLETEDILERLVLISKNSDGQLISTYQDILNKRPTEIDTLNFAIVSVAEKLRKPDIVRETKLLGELTRLKSDLSIGR